MELFRPAGVGLVVEQGIFQGAAPPWRRWDDRRHDLAASAYEEALSLVLDRVQHVGKAPGGLGRRELTH